MAADPDHDAINWHMNADIAILGLGVMGRNLTLNLASQGRTVAVFDRDAGRLQTHGRQRRCGDLRVTGGGGAGA